MSTGISSNSSNDVHGSLAEMDNEHHSLVHTFAYIIVIIIIITSRQVIWVAYKLYTWTVCAIDVIGTNCNNFAQQQLCALRKAILGILIT